MLKRNKKTQFHNDKDSWSQLQKGNLDALGYLYDKYVDDLFAIGFSIYSDKMFIQDVIHDMFLELYSYHDRLSNAENIKAYLISSFKRSMFKRKKLKELNFENNDFETRSDLLENSECYENKVINLERVSYTQKRVKGIMESLTPRQAKVLELKFSEDKGYEDIASELKVTVSSARTLVYRTIKELRKKTATFI
jgi:RNA polymerase sigma-70 factor (ECF subfamily)